MAIVDLLDRVREAMQQRHNVNPEVFEECAVALLKPIFPGLTAVTGGHDFGRDGDIYFPFHPDDQDSRGRMTVTVVAP